MTYSVRNPFYLRISKNTVLPLYVYLDERHVHWMSDAVLQHVLSDLRPNILPKLKAEADILPSSTTHKKATVDTHRGDTYQFCYFIHKTESHSVLIKSRKFTLAPLQKVAQKSKSKPSKKPRKRKEASQESSPTITQHKRRRTTKRLPSDGLVGNDVEMADIAADVSDEDDEFIPDPDPDISDRNITELEMEEHEEKPKPILGLTYQGFNIYGHCLCIVVEPWPVVRMATLVPSLESQLTKQTTLQTTASTVETPLFLPEEPEVEEIPRPSGENRAHINQAYLHRILDPEDAMDGEDDMGGMMEFSQVLYNVGDSRAGAVNDDDDMDGGILFGDADEFKEL